MAMGTRLALTFFFIRHHSTPAFLKPSVDAKVYMGFAL